MQSEDAGTVLILLVFFMQVLLLSKSGGLLASVWLRLKYSVEEQEVLATCFLSNDQVIGNYWP